MNRWINTKQDEGWLALCICILANVTTEQAFRLVVNPEAAGVNRSWTEYDIQQIELDRKEGLTWPEIADKYNTGRTNVSSLYYRYKKGLSKRKRGTG